MSYYLKNIKKALMLNRPKLRRFLTKLEKNPPAHLDHHAEVLDKEVWSEMNCLVCSNCCREMTPVFTFSDMKRISAYLGMSIKAFKEKWLYQEKKSGQWMNISRPCQFLNLQDNKCTIYEVRPEDCSGFPHLTKKKMVDYIHVHKQNVQYCPATSKMVEKMMALFKQL